MARSALPVLIALAALAAAGGAWAQASDRYGPDRPARLRGTTSPAPGPLLTWPGKEARLRASSAKAATPGPFRQPVFAEPPPLPPPLAAGPQASRADADPRAMAAPQALPTSIYDPPQPASRPAAAAPVRPQTYARAPAPAPGPRYGSGADGGDLAPRRYSVVREFGYQPDRIDLPDPSVLAYSPEVAEAVLAQQQRDKAASDPGPASPADLDMLERQQQEAERELAREKARERARRAAE